MTLFEFKSEKSVANWFCLNDTVMGGISNSQLSFVEQGVVKFHGEVSLENNGGFSQIKYAKTHFDLSHFKGLKLSVKGDNKNYQLRLQTDAPHISYAQSFFARDKWHEVKLEFRSFKATYRGQDVENAPVLNKADIRSFSLLIADKQAGRFALLFSSIKTY